VEFFFQERYLSIKFAARALVALLLAAHFSSPSAAQQTTPPSNPDPSSQSSGNDARDPAKPDAAKQDTTKEKAKTDSPAQGQSGSGASSSDNSGTQGRVAGTSNDRLFYTLPNFLSVQKGNLPPLSVGDKFKVVALGNFDFIQYPCWAIVSAIGQANNSEPQFRQGWLAYAKRYGTTAGDSSV